MRGGNVLAAESNRFRNHPTISYPGSSVHAEQAALKRAYGTGAVLYVARLANTGLWALSRPCPRCWEAIDAAGVKTVVYTTAGGFGVERVTTRRQVPDWTAYATAC